MNEKQQQLTFDKGITNVPSDALCSDNALEESLGMVYDNGEHRVIQQPIEFMTSTSITVLFVHKLADSVNYVGYEGNKIRWGTKNNSDVYTPGSYYDGANCLYQFSGNGVPQVTAIGKTLILNTSEGIKYYLWRVDDAKYYDLGRIPEPKMKFAMAFDYGTGSVFSRGVYSFTKTGDATGIIENGATIPNHGKQEEYNNLAIGLYSKVLNHHALNKRFANPFFVRYAIEMYDGSYTYQSAPILMLPSISRNCRALVANNEMAIWVYALQLVCKAEYDYTEWQDIVKGVTVFASAQIHLYDTSGDQKPSSAPSEESDTFVLHDNMEVYYGRDEQGNKYIIDDSNHYACTTARQFNCFIPLNIRSTEDVLDDIKSTSNFYKLFEAGLKRSYADGWQYGTKLIKSHVLENLVTQEQLPVDFFSHCPINGKRMNTYNNRLLLSNIDRGFYDGFDFFMPYNKLTLRTVIGGATEAIYDPANPYKYNIYVWIRSSHGTRVVMKEFESRDIIGLYFYYPDPRAYHVKIFVNDELYKDVDLEEHPYLNGAYYLEGLPTSTTTIPSGTVEKKPKTNYKRESLYNHLYISEVNNPFVFRPEGDVTIGNGEVFGVASLTQALSQGQFGQYPLIIFTTEGTWAASIGSTGYLSAVHPTSREICNNDKSITQTDGAVFFSSNKGLMVVVGNDVKCVSEQLRGKLPVSLEQTPVLVGANPDFAEFLKTAFIAYDYRDSLLWLFDGSQNGSRYCWIYNIKSGAFAHYDFKMYGPITNVVNNYPDYLLQYGVMVFSLLNRPDINHDGTTSGNVFTPNRYTGIITTRPMKLENALALKSIMQIRHILQMDGTMTMRIFGSNNLKSAANTWVELHSLRGTPWKYYKFRYSFSNMLATDRFAGTMLITQERRINKLR